MKNNLLLLIIFASAIGFGNSSLAQSVYPTNSTDTPVYIPCSGNRTIPIKRSANGWSGGGSYSWSVSPTGQGVTISSTYDDDQTLTVSTSATPGIYTVTVTRNTKSASVSIEVLPNQATISFQSGQSNMVAPIGSQSVEGELRADICGNGDYTWGIVPSINVVHSTNSTDKRDFEFEFTSGATGLYTITATRGSNSVSQEIELHSSNMWSIGNSGDMVYSYAIESGNYSAGPLELFDPFPNSSYGTSAMGRSPYPQSVDGYFYYLRNDWPNTGTVYIYGANGDGTNAGTLLGSKDINGSSSNACGFVRLGMDTSQNISRGWVLANDDDDLILVKITADALNSITSSNIEIVDPSVTLVGGLGLSNFQNGDLCLSKAGVLFAVANSNGETEIYVGLPNGNNTELEMKWNVLDENSNPFDGSVNGVCFDQYGGMYLSTSSNSNVTNGIYYLDPATILTDANTIQATLVFEQSGLTDLGTNVFPQSTPLPVAFGDIIVNGDNQRANINWTTFTEKDVDHFVVERSIDAVTFKQVRVVKAKGQSSEMLRYDVTDDVSELTGTVYYRVHSVDFDGKRGFSKIVGYNIKRKSINSIFIVPNPVNEMIYLVLNSENDNNQPLHIININGQVIFSKNIDIRKGQNRIDLGKISNELPHGQYLVRLGVGNDIQTVRFIKN